MRLFVGGLTLFIAGPALAAPEGPLQSLVCQSPGEVFSCRCPRLDPAKVRLVSIKANLSGSQTVDVTVTSPTVQDVTVTVAGHALLDPGFGWPASGSGTVQAGPSGSQPVSIVLNAQHAQVYTDKPTLDNFRGTGDRKLTTSNAWKSITASSGASIASVAPKQMRTSVRLEYAYRSLLGPHAPVGSLEFPRAGVPASSAPGKTGVAALRPRTVACTP